MSDFARPATPRTKASSKRRAHNPSHFVVAPDEPDVPPVPALPAGAVTPRSALNHLESLLSSKCDEIQAAGQLGERLLQQQAELEAKVRELELLQGDAPSDSEDLNAASGLSGAAPTNPDDVAQEVKAKLQALQEEMQTWETGNDQLFDQLNHKVPTPTAQDMVKAPLQEQQSSRRARAGRAFNDSDAAFAAGIGHNLVKEVKRLQALYEEANAKLKDLTYHYNEAYEKCCEYDQRKDLFEQHEGENRQYKDTNWQLEIKLQETESALAETDDKLNHAESERSRFNSLSDALRQDLDASHLAQVDAAERRKALESQLQAATSSINSREREAERKAVDLSAAEQEIDRLQTLLRNRTAGEQAAEQQRHDAEDEASKAADEPDVFLGPNGPMSPTRRSLAPNLQAALADDDEEQNMFEGSPSMFPATPSKNTAAEVAALKSALAKLQKNNSTLKNALNREKERSKRSPASPVGGDMDDDQENESPTSSPASSVRSRSAGAPRRGGRGGRRGHFQGGVRSALGRGALTARTSDSEEEVSEDFSDPEHGGDVDVEGPSESGSVLDHGPDAEPEIQEEHDSEALGQSQTRFAPSRGSLELDPAFAATSFDDQRRNSFNSLDFAAFKAPSVRSRPTSGAWSLHSTGPPAVAPSPETADANVQTDAVEPEIREVEVEKVVYVDREVPVERVVHVDREVPVEKLVERPRPEVVDVHCQTDPVAPEIQIKEVIQHVEVPVEVEKEVVRDMPVDKIVEKEVIKEVPVDRIVEKEVEVEKEKIVYVDRPIEIEKPAPEVAFAACQTDPIEPVYKVEEVIKEVPFETVREVTVEKEVPVDKIIEVEKEKIVYVDKPVEIERPSPPVTIAACQTEPVEPVVQIQETIKEVPIETTRDVPVERIVEVEKEVVKEVPVDRVVEVEKEVFRDVPVEKLVEVEKEKIVYVDRPVEVQVPAPVPETLQSACQTDVLEPEVREVIKEVAVPLGKASRRPSQASLATLAGKQPTDALRDYVPAEESTDVDTDFEDARETIGAATPSYDRHSAFFSLHEDAAHSNNTPNIKDSTTNSVRDFYSLRDPDSSHSLDQPDTPTRTAQQAKLNAAAPPTVSVDAGTQTDFPEPEPVPQVFAASPAERRSQKLSAGSDESTQVFKQQPSDEDTMVSRPTYLSMIGQDRMVTPEPSASPSKPGLDSTYHSVYSPLHTPTKDHATVASASPIADRSKPPQLTMPPPPSMPPPKSAVSPRKAMNRPQRPSSPPPPDLLQRAQTPISELMQHYPGYAGKSPRATNTSNSRAPFSSMPPNAMAAGGSRSVPRAATSTGNLKSMNEFGVSTERSDSPHTLPSKMPRQNTASSRRSHLPPGSPSLSIRSAHSARGSFASDMTSDGDEEGEAEETPIQNITKCMIGEHLFKYTRGVIGYGEKRHRRFFWIHPYTTTLYWSPKDPGAKETNATTSKSIPIKGVRQIVDPNPYPPGLHQQSIVVKSDSREIKFTAGSLEQHKLWYESLKFLLGRNSSEAMSDAESMNENMFDGSTSHFGSFGKKAKRKYSIPSFGRAKPSSAAMYSVSAKSDPHLLESKPPKSRMSTASAHMLKRPGTPAAEYLAAQENASPRSIRSFSTQDFAAELGDVSGDMIHAADLADDDDEDGPTGYEGLENVRVCCGEHDVSHLSHRHGPAGTGSAAHRHRHHSQPASALVSPPMASNENVRPSGSARQGKKSLGSLFNTG